MELRELKITTSDDVCRITALTAINKLIKGISSLGYRVELNEVNSKYVIDRLILTTVSINIFDALGNLTRYRFSLDQMMLLNECYKAVTDISKIPTSYEYYDTNAGFWGTYNDIINSLKTDRKEEKKNGK